MHPVSELRLINGRYQANEILGRGALSTTYAATDRQTGAEVVCKEITVRGLAGWKPFEAFEREAAVLRNIDHPGVPRFVDAFQEEDPSTGLHLCLVMERVAGKPLLELIRRGHRWQESDARSLLERLLGILGHLHALSPPVIHRDVKPSNVLIRPDGQPVLIDFGGVRDLATRSGHGSLTVVGTVGYMPPEQAMGAAVPGSDLFALGATMVHALTHTHPADLPRQGMRVLFADRVGCSTGLVRVLERMLEPDPGARYSHAAEVLEDLQRPPEAMVRARPGELQDAAQPPLPLHLPPAPRSLTRATLANIDTRADRRATNGQLAGVGTAAAWAVLGLPSVPGWLGGTVLAAIVAGGLAFASLLRRAARDDYRALYVNGPAVRGEVASVKSADGVVRYHYDVDGRTWWGEMVYLHGQAAFIESGDPVLVVYDPGDPLRCVATVVLPEQVLAQRRQRR